MTEANDQHPSDRYDAAMRQQRRIAERNRADVRFVVVDGKQFRISPTVYVPSGDTLLLIRHVHGREDGSFLDIGCGCGAVAVHLSYRFREGMAVDINYAAVDDTAHNLDAHRVSNVSVGWSNVFSALSGRWDVICFNGPYDDWPSDDSSSAMFWDPNHRSKACFLKEVGIHLNPGGHVFYGAAEYSRDDGDAAAALLAAANLEIVSKYSTPGKRANFDYVLYELARG